MLAVENLDCGALPAIDSKIVVSQLHLKKAIGRTGADEVIGGLGTQADTVSPRFDPEIHFMVTPVRENKVLLQVLSSCSHCVPPLCG